MKGIGRLVIRAGAVACAALVLVSTAYADVTLNSLQVPTGNQLELVQRP